MNQNLCDTTPACCCYLHMYLRVKCGSRAGAGMRGEGRGGAGRREVKCEIPMRQLACCVTLPVASHHPSIRPHSLRKQLRLRASVIGCCYRRCCCMPYLASESGNRVRSATSSSTFSTCSCAGAVVALAGSHHRRGYESALLEARLQLLVLRRWFHIGEWMPVLQRSDGTRGDGRNRGNRSDRDWLVLVQLTPAEGAAVFTQAVIYELTSSRVIVRVFVVAYGPWERFSVKSAVSGDLRFGAPFNVIVLHWLDVPRALWFLWCVRLFGRPFVSWLYDFFRLVAGIGKYAKSVTHCR